MRHFIWYDSAGSLRGVHRHSGGWPIHEDLRDGQSASSKVRNIRNLMAREPEFAGFAEFSCVCPPDVVMCLCAHRATYDHYFDGNAVVAKPQLLIELDGQEIPHTPSFDDTYTTLPPGGTAQLVLKAAVPDGHSVEVVNARGRVDLIQGTTHLTFMDGVSEAITIQVPDQGLSGIVGGQSNLIRRFAVAVLGWA